MHAVIIISFLLLSFNAFGLDVTLRVDGQALRSIDADRVNIITSNTGILIDVRTEPKSSPQPPTPPTPDLTDCNPHPPGVGIGNLNWRSPGGVKRYALRSGTLALKFTTTGNPAYAGQVNTTHTTTNPTTRTHWISRCAGGEPLPHCLASGKEGVTLYWTQNPTTRAPCKLQTNSTYYINVKNALPGNLNASTCSGTCPFYLVIYTNQKS